MDQHMDESTPITPVAPEPSPGSSMASLPAMPPAVQRHIITEYNDAVYNPRAIPKIPLRVPQKNPRRSLGPPAHPGSFVPSSPASTITSTGHLSPPYKADSAAGEMDREDDATTPEAEQTDEKHWFEHRKRSRRFLVIVGIVTLIIIVGLAVGLPLGLRNKVSTQGSQTDDADGSGLPFPAGAFSFKTSLQKTEAGCTSKNTTWRCDPTTQGGSSTFYWDITQLNYYTYTITSSQNPFAPDFTNISMKIRDYNKPTERLEFSFLMNKTVIPSDAGSSTNRAAKCAYADTKFAATLYTRKRGTTLIDPPAHHAKYAAWPGDMEIIQSLDSTIGQPVCQDAISHPIADVSAGPGTCQCQYSNTDSQ